MITSSGTTGTISIIPKDKAGANHNMELWKMFLFQRFGKEPTPEELDPQVDVIWPNYAKGKLGHLRMADMLERSFTGGDPSRFHALYSEEVSADLMFLASKLRRAASRGELDRVQIDPEAARAQVASSRRWRRGARTRWRRSSSAAPRSSRGKRVFMTGAYHLMYELAAEGLERGVKNVFAKDSAILTGGGLKGFVLPENYMDVIQEFLGVDRIQEGYGMSEISAFHWACDEKHYHVQPWVIPFLLDPDTSEPLPREGVVTGRAAFYDFLNNSHWGGIISGDEITIDWSTPCRCGLASVHIHHEIMRYSEKQGVEDDRISCSATEEVKTRGAALHAGDRGMTAFRVPLFVRGELIEDDWVEFGGRSQRAARSARPIRASTSTGCRSRARWRSPTSRRCRSRRSPTCSPSSAARSTSRRTATSRRPTRPVWRLRTIPPRSCATATSALPWVFRRENIYEIAEARIGIDYLDGWVEPHARRRPRAARSARSARARCTCRPATAGSSRR